MSTEPSITLGVLLRTGHCCERVRSELATCDATGIARARDSFNSTLSFLGGLLDEDMQRELSVLCPQVNNEPSPISLGLAYAGLSGWIDGLLSGVRIVSVSDDSVEQPFSGTPPGGYL